MCLPVTSTPHSGSMNDMTRLSVSTVPLIRNSYSVLSNGSGCLMSFSKYFSSMILHKLREKILLSSLKSHKRTHSFQTTANHVCVYTPVSYDSCTYTCAVCVYLQTYQMRSFEMSKRVNRYIKYNA